ncbi:MAG: hypothetical protein S4CHLAM20_14680 [Chlamydiia bacterium]|nr:hypothetical protein [Chlamydiia bacterium]
MNNFLSNLDVFSDALTQLKKDEPENPFFVQPIGELEEIDQYLCEIPGVFFLDKDLILDHPKDGTHYFHISNEKLSGPLGIIGQTIINDRKDFSLYVLYSLFMYLTRKGSEGSKGSDVDYQPARHPFNRNKHIFANKLFYYLELPVDPFTLKEWGVEPDMRAVNYQKVVEDI